MVRGVIRTFRKKWYLCVDLASEDLIYCLYSFSVIKHTNTVGEKWLVTHYWRLEGSCWDKIIFKLLQSFCSPIGRMVKWMVCVGQNFRRFSEFQNCERFQDYNLPLILLFTCHILITIIPIYKSNKQPQLNWKTFSSFQRTVNF